MPWPKGITEAGTLFSGNIKSAVGLGIILYQGIGDTIRVSLTGDPIEEIKSARQILKTLGLRKGGVEVVSCPTCGRTRIDLIHLANQVETMVSGMEGLDGVKVAVMGCVVNGPGEAREADIGIAGGVGEGLIIKKGEILRKVPEEDTIDLEVRQAYLNMREAERRFNSTAMAVKQAEEDYFIATEKYKVGAGIILDVIDAELALSQARLNYASAQYDYARYKANLEYVIGTPKGETIDG